MFSARYRRQRGQDPLWGTSWVPVYKYNNSPWRPYDPHASIHQPVDPNPAPPYSPPPYTNYYGPPMPPHQQQQYEMQGGNLGGNNNEQYFRQEHTGQHFQTPNSPPPAHLLSGRKDNLWAKYVAGFGLGIGIGIGLELRIGLGIGLSCAGGLGCAGLFAIMRFVVMYIERAYVYRGKFIPWFHF